jgi:hypothetical protein
MLLKTRNFFTEYGWGYPRRAVTFRLHTAQSLCLCRIRRVPHPCAFFLAHGWETTKLNPHFHFEP